jgi:HlyD family secretion protein
MSTVTNPSEARISEASYARAARPARRSGWAWALLLVVVVVVVVGAGWFLRDVRSVVGIGGPDSSMYRVEPVTLAITLTEDGELKPLRSTELKNEVEGQTTIMFLVDESTRVAKGDLLVELAADRLLERIETEELELGTIRSDLDGAKAELDLQISQNESEIKQAELDLVLAKTDLEKYENGDLIKEQKSIEIDIDETNLKLERKRDELDKNKKLRDREFVTQAKVEQIELELKTLEMRLTQAELAMRILHDYDEPMMKQRMTSAIDQAKDALARATKRAESRTQQAAAKVEKYAGLLGLRTEKLRRLKDQVTKCKIVAPSDGVVQYPDDGGGWRGGEQMTVGSQVHEGQTLVVLPDTSEMVVSARIHEADRHRILEDMECIVKVPAVPGRTFTGRVSKIAKFADSANRWLNPDLKEHTTEIRLDATDAPLSPGDTAEIEILVDRFTDTLAVPVQSVFSRGSKNFVFNGSGRTAEPVEVELGASNSSLVQITSGVSAGALVHLHPSEKMLAMLPSVEESDEERPEHPAIPRPAPVNAHKVDGREPAADVAAKGEGKASGEGSGS